MSSEGSCPAEPGTCLVLYKLSPPWIRMHLWLLIMAAWYLFSNTWACAPFLTSLLRGACPSSSLLPFRNLWHGTGSHRPSRRTSLLRCSPAASETRPQTRLSDVDITSALAVFIVPKKEGGFHNKRISAQILFATCSSYRKWT